MNVCPSVLLACFFFPFLSCCCYLIVFYIATLCFVFSVVSENCVCRFSVLAYYFIFFSSSGVNFLALIRCCCCCCCNYIKKLQSGFSPIAPSPVFCSLISVDCSSLTLFFVSHPYLLSAILSSSRFFFSSFLIFLTILSISFSCRSLLYLYLPSFLL